MTVLLSKMTVACHELCNLMREWDSHTMECFTCQDFENREQLPRFPLNSPCLIGSKILQKVLDRLNNGPSL